MLEWYSNNKVGVFFDDIPRVGIRYILPSTEKEMKKSIKKYPFINKRPLKVLLFDKKKNKKYDFAIPKYYCFDGASVPRFFWRVIGSNTDNKFLIAALVHDVLCENCGRISASRFFFFRQGQAPALRMLGMNCPCFLQNKKTAGKNPSRFSMCFSF